MGSMSVLGTIIIIAVIVTIVFGGLSILFSILFFKKRNRVFFYLSLVAIISHIAYIGSTTITLLFASGIFSNSGKNEPNHPDVPIEGGRITEPTEWLNENGGKLQLLTVDGYGATTDMPYGEFIYGSYPTNLVYDENLNNQIEEEYQRAIGVLNKEMPSSVLSYPDFYFNETIYPSDVRNDCGQTPVFLYQGDQICEYRKMLVVEFDGQINWKWYQVCPIKWVTLSQDAEYIYGISEQVLDVTYYDSRLQNIDYDITNVNDYLNKDMFSLLTSVTSRYQGEKNVYPVCENNRTLNLPTFLDLENISYHDFALTKNIFSDFADIQNRIVNPDGENVYAKNYEKVDTDSQVICMTSDDAYADSVSVFARNENALYQYNGLKNKNFGVRPTIKLRKNPITAQSMPQDGFSEGQEPEGGPQSSEATYRYELIDDTKHKKITYDGDSVLSETIESHFYTSQVVQSQGYQEYVKYECDCGHCYYGYEDEDMDLCENNEQRLHQTLGGMNFTATMNVQQKNKTGNLLSAYSFQVVNTLDGCDFKEIDNSTGVRTPLTVRYEDGRVNQYVWTGYSNVYEYAENQQYIEGDTVNEMTYNYLSPRLNNLFKAITVTPYDVGDFLTQFTTTNTTWYASSLVPVLDIDAQTMESLFGSNEYDLTNMQIVPFTMSMKDLSVTIGDKYIEEIKYKVNPPQILTSNSGSKIKINNVYEDENYFDISINISDIFTSELIEIEKTA